MRRLLILAISFGLIAAACGSDGGDGSTTTSTDARTTTSDAEEETTTSGSESTTTSTTAATSGEGGPDCLVGTWILDSDAFVENFSEIFASAGMPDAEASALDGTFTVELSADGTLTAVREGWGFAIQTSQGDMTVEINGEETGTWSADGSMLTVSIDISDLALDASIEVDGQVLPMPAAPVDIPEGIATDSTYLCEGDTVTLMNAGVESILNRA